MDLTSSNIHLAQSVPDFSGLPGWAQAIAYTVLAVAFGLAMAAARFGIHLGVLKKASTNDSETPNHTAQVAAVIVDPTPLREAVAAVDVLTVTLTQSNSVGKGNVSATIALARATKDVAAALQEVVRTQAQLVESITQYVEDQREQRESEEIDRKIREAEQKGYEKALEEAEKKRPGRG